MNIWVIARSYPTKGNSLRGSFELEQAKMLAKRGHNVTYLALVFHHKNKVKKWGYCTWKEEDITVCVQSQFYAPDRLHLHLKHFQQKKWEDFLERVEEESGQPDVIHVHYPSMITVPETIFAYQKAGVRIVATEHWSRVLNQKVDKYEKNQLKTYVENADAFLCVGGPLRDAVKAITNTSREIPVIPNVVPANFQRKNKSKRGIFSFVAVGRLAPVKQFDLLIEAYAKAFRAQENVRLTIVGGGGEEKRLRKLVKQYGLEESVVLTGTLSREKTAEIMAASEALVCSSKYETFGVPVIEAWACGLPVVITDGLGLLEFWQDGLGKVVSWKRADEMAEAMQKVYENYDQYDLKRISEYAKARFSEPVIYNRLMRIYGMSNKEPDADNFLEMDKTNV